MLDPCRIILAGYNRRVRAMKKVRKPKLNTLSLSALVVSLVVLTGVLLLARSNGMLFFKATETSSQQTSPYSIEDVQSKKVTPVSDTQSSNTLDGTSNPTPLTSKEIAPVVPCKLDVEQKAKDYLEEVHKEKDSLDSKLSFQVGLNISGEYVETYNTQISSLYDKYVADAKAQGCALPIQKPDLLPSTYPY